MVKIKKSDRKPILIMSGIILIILFAGYTGYTILQPAELYISPGGTTQATPGQTLNFDIMYYNQFATGYYFQTEVWELPNCGAISGTIKKISSSKYVAPGKYVEDTISFNAPTSPGTYVYSFINYYGLTSPPGTWDHEVCTTIVVTSATPTPKETPPPTDLCKNVVCNEECNGKLTLSNGVCNSGTGICSYEKSYVDGNCGYVEGTPIPTYTTPAPTSTGTLPPGGEDEGISSELLWGGAIIGGAIIFALYMITRPVGKKKK